MTEREMLQTAHVNRTPGERQLLRRADVRWSREKVIATILARNAMAAVAGRDCPIARKVLARIEGKV